ncbi:MAG: restriction endonuclease subunit S [Gammaproteobacteria bacterium]|nr:restriction endonuclease subunit S [Gammaproteobacteria bacterium]
MSEEPSYGTSARALPRANESDPRYIRITDFGDDGIELPHEFKTPASWAEKHVLEPGDLLLARSGATVGKSYIHVAPLDPAIYAGYCIRFRFNDVVLPEFVYSFTKTEPYAAWAAAIQRPSGQPNINKEEFKSLEIPVPPLSVQKKLVRGLSAARKERDGLLQRSGWLARSVDELVRAELKLPEVKSRDGLGFGVRLDTTREGRSLCPDFFHPERMAALRAIEGVPNRRLGELVAFIREQVKAAASGERYVGLGSVVSGTGELGRDLESAEGASFCFEKGDVLYGRLRPYLNKVWLASFEGLCSTEFHVLRTKDPDALRPEYLAVVMRTGLIVKQTKHMMTGNTHPRIANRDVENLLVPLADAAVQQRIVDEVLGRQAEAVRLRQEAAEVWRVGLADFLDALVLGSAP